MFKEIQFGEGNIIVDVVFSDNLPTDDFCKAMEFVRMWNLGNRSDAITYLMNGM